MKKLTYSDTDFFYRTFQDLVYKSDMMAVITDFKSPGEMPERGRRLFRIGNKKSSRGTNKTTGPVLDERYQVTIGQDRFKRLRILISV